jgi:uncharacterized protein YecE (DUF72 family)
MPLHLGISGWSYRNWVGPFYPKGLPARGFLAYYARHYNAVEINSTFYRTPAPETAARWRDAVPPGFRFAVKLPRAITHDRLLESPAEEHVRFLAALEPLADRRGALLAQLPPNLKRDDALVLRFLDHLDAASATPAWSITIEFRHRSWLDPAVTALLDARGVAVCVSDMPRCPVTEPNRAGPVYIRRHGPGGGYTGRYSDENLSADAALVAASLAAGREVWFFFNHGLGGHALSDADRMLALLPGAREGQGAREYQPRLFQ